jgi:hypothetical protein
MTSSCPMPACSRSLTGPLGFSNVISWLRSSRERLAPDGWGVIFGEVDAAHADAADRGRPPREVIRNDFPKRVGRSVRSRTRRSKDSSGTCWRDTHPSDFDRASWRMQKRPRLPGIPMGRRSSPRRLCQDFLLTRCFPEALEDIQVALSGGVAARWSCGRRPRNPEETEVQDPSFTSLDSERAP